MLGTLFSATAHAPRSARVWRGALLLTGALGLAVVSLQSIPSAHAATALRYQRGYYLDNGWYCYGWASGAYHCTTRWHRAANGQIVSDNPSWVPNSLATSSNSVGASSAPVSAPSGSTSASSAQASPPPAGLSQWANPVGYHAYAMSSHGWYPSLFGWCTWYASYRRQDEPLMQLGNAYAWAANAPRHGLRTGTTPAAGATVVFQPHVQGASGLGHVGHVEKVYSNGWFLISEMSFYWNGGGWGRVSYRYVHTGPGVSFIY